MRHEISRRDALRRGALGVAAIAGAPLLTHASMRARKPLYDISLAEWSLHKPLFAGEITNLDFAAEARGMGFGAIEYVNSFFKDKAGDEAYLKDLNTRASDSGVRQLLIMCDGEGAIGDADDAARAKSVENHHKWVGAAATLGCHSIRVNAASSGTYEEQQDRAADGLRRLCQYADGYGINVIVENHGGLSSNGEWLAGVMEKVGHPRCGTLPDFGNFCFDWGRADDPDAWYDRYDGVRELMPFAKAVSAKSHEFNDEGDEVRTDYHRMMKIVVDAGYTGFVGVEYEGEKHPPREGIRLTKALLERVREDLGG